MPKNPILSVLHGEDHVVYLYLADKIMAPKAENPGSYMIAFDMKHHSMLSAARASWAIISGLTHQPSSEATCSSAWEESAETREGCMHLRFWEEDLIGRGPVVPTRGVLSLSTE
ncbi:hypothetical protein ACP4OV_017727 [Aristida adscensionis]